MADKEIIVTGGRNYSNYTAVSMALRALEPTLVIHGDCSGADTLAKQWAINNKIEHDPHPANWTKHGKAAGPIRNTDMLDLYPMAIVVAFPGGAGTKNCINTAKQKGHLVIQVL